MLASFHRFLQAPRTHFQAIALLLLRVTGGALMLSHGFPKLEKLTSASHISFADPLGIGPIPSLALAVFAEVVCAILLIAGFLTRYAAIPLIFTMAVVVFIIHIGDPWVKMEKPLLYLGLYISVFLLGPGSLSVDHILPSKR